jgi:hypothetical protein
MDVVLLEETPIAAAAVHDLVTEATFQEAGGFPDDTREPGNPVEFLGFWRKL